MKNNTEKNRSYQTPKRGIKGEIDNQKRGKFRVARIQCVRVCDLIVVALTHRVCRQKSERHSLTFVVYFTRVCLRYGNLLVREKSLPFSFFPVLSRSLSLSTLSDLAVLATTLRSSALIKIKVIKH